MEKKKAAYFFLSRNYIGRPFDDSIINALLELNYEIDIYAPNIIKEENKINNFTQCYPVEYRLNWLKKHFNFKYWKKYNLFLGTADLPMAIVGVISSLTGRKCVTICDEIYVGGYQGFAKSYWKIFAKYGMRRSIFTVITDKCRAELQRYYARLPCTHNFIQYPNVYNKYQFLHDADFWRKKLDQSRSLSSISVIFP